MGTVGAVGEDGPVLVDVGAFDRVDASGTADALVAWMAHQRRGGADDALEVLDVDDGDRVLDVGCGPGADLAALFAALGITVVARCR